nr:S8 family serine peptidase [Planctomycetota bacterium]
MKIKIITSFFIVFILFGLPLFTKAMTDPFYSKQWYLTKIKAPEAWKKVSATPDIVIAVIDSGIQTNHPDLANNIWKNIGEIPGNNIDDDHNGFVDDYEGWNFVNNTADVNPDFFATKISEIGIVHGTMISGIIAAGGNNGIGVTGEIWQAKIMPIKALDDNGEGSVGSIVKAIDYAINNGADIINLSFVGFDYNHSLQDAITRAYRAGVIVVAAAGNEQSNGDGYDTDKQNVFPACFDAYTKENMVIGVAATDAIDQKANFSSYGKCVDISAPGISFFNTVAYKSDTDLKFNKYYNGYWSGTSLSTPLVSAALALIMEVNPELNNKEIIEILLGSADNINKLNPAFLGKLGSGRLNVSLAAEVALAKLNSQKGFLLSAPFLTIKTSSKNSESLEKNDSKNEITKKVIEKKLVEKNGPETQSLKIFSGVSNELVSDFFPYGEDAKFGYNIATGDIDGDGVSEIITGAGAGGGPHVRIFGSHGELKG